jgi:hypothetical protein
MNANHEETMACQEMEARQEDKPTSLDRKPEVAEQREVPVEDAEVMPVGEPKKFYILSGPYTISNNVITLSE